MKKRRAVRKGSRKSSKKSEPRRKSQPRSSSKHDILYVCGRCGSRYHHPGRCHSCRVHLEPECRKCLSAEGNCVCRLHGSFHR